ncbi:carboxyvinyl-carboxyphosphonate phosphorylmutase [Pseudoalteromonas luteoviolacea]|uniref:Carboxyvinyl-carboxyphosphonate phosphorylmutase n=1 Tax=Pseudoalteromonas luteoviolacea TaxID=43657 RepID=A0A1C0TW01_9GAMM|nr:isocitrate lyase/phosphoenolpyruvate mutase family protein [Pseudoalteromonas luteoviolacea]MBQ4810011.1 isocitrate lyase/phosphoenolpyruvate mutase family protein [Pseudoalteromonas luteoviolacea]OCQ23490.1 carboxyvinyl-carboxyphosphonate phosphorylmutase [Pseudoalteromonas luteoviolacea]
MNKFEMLHQQTQPLLIANVWDAESVKRAESAGYQAIGTSSAAVAAVLGYEDGEQMPFEALLFMVKRISASSSLPLSVDIESGYSRDPKEVAANIRQLVDLGVVGVNIEDSRVTQTRALIDKDTFAASLSEIMGHLRASDTQVFVNVRCDAFLLGLDNATEEAVKRAKSYQSAGADGLFFPCVTVESDIKAVVAATPLPINVMAMPELPTFDALSKLGVKRISMGNFAHLSISNQLEKIMKDIKSQRDCNTLFAPNSL